MMKNKALLICAALFIVYWISAIFITSETLRVSFTGIALGVATVIVVTWAPAAWRAFKYGAGEPEEQLIIAVFMTWASIVLSRAYAAMYYVLDEPYWLRLSPVSGFVALTAAVSGLLFLTAPGIVPGAIQGRYKFHMIAAISLGCLIAGFMLGLSGGYTLGLEAN